MTEDEISELSSPDNGGVEMDVSSQVDTAPKSIRESVKEAFKEVKERQSGEKADERSRDANGKFVKSEQQKSKSSELSEANIDAKPLNEPVVKAQAPEGLPSDIKAEWEKLSPKAQQALIKREADIHKGMTTMDEERNFAKEMNKVILPYMPLINSVGSNPSAAISEMLNYAHILQTASPQAKAQLLWKLAERHGADMRITPQAAQQPAYQLQSVQQELQQLKQQQDRLPEVIKQQQEQAQIQATIQAFASDPANVHYERVKPIMAALLQNNAATDMKDAYQKACYADPEIRSMQEAEKARSDDAKRVAGIKAKSDAARTASVSMKGLPGMNGAQIQPSVQRSLRDELKHNLRAITNH